MSSTPYIGITIGPIYGTMSLTRSPAGLWMASSLFSWIARELVGALCAQGIDENAFAAPFFTLRNQKVCAGVDAGDVRLAMQNIGVGLFHDRIIFSAVGVEEPMEKVRRAKAAVIQTLADKLSGESDDGLAKWLEQYLIIYAVAVDVPDDQSPLIYIGRYLSAMELEPRFLSSERENRLLTIMENVTATGEEGARNDAVKDSFLVNDLPENGKDWVLYKSEPGKKNTRIRDLADIASPGNDAGKLKCMQYYAVLKSDGDSMSKMLENLKSTDELRSYSSQCLEFCARVARCVKDYGGVPIFAGGDDLLALLPVLGYSPEKGPSFSILELVDYIRETLFNDVFKEARQKYGGKPTISFGISIQYYKSPLYEALERAEEMLYLAKEGDKNACAMILQKHSGQQVCFVEERMDHCWSEHEMTLCARIGGYNRAHAQGAELLKNAGYQIERFAGLFKQVLLTENISQWQRGLNTLFENLFDNAGQQRFRPYLDDLKGIALQTFEEMPRRKGESDEDYAGRVMNQLQGIVRILHFMSEEGTEA